jgi:hypothetical protein
MGSNVQTVVAKAILDRRIPDQQLLKEEVEAWEADRNKKHAKADWRFTTENARVKLKRLYPAPLPSGYRTGLSTALSRHGPLRGGRDGAYVLAEQLTDWIARAGRKILVLEPRRIAARAADGLEIRAEDTCRDRHGGNLYPHDP